MSGANRLFDDDRNAYVGRHGAKTHLIVAGLVSQFACDYARADGSLGRRFKLCLDGETAGENCKVLSADLYFFRLWISDRFSKQQAISPGEFQRNDEFVFGLVAVDVDPGGHFEFQSLRDGCASLRNDFGWRRDDEFTLLRLQEEWQQAECCEQNRSSPHLQEDVQFHLNIRLFQQAQCARRLCVRRGQS